MTERKLKPRRKWTEQINADLLSCKREAVAMTLLEQPPLDGNGRRKGYIRIMNELWDAKGYGDLGLASQNLRDQAARLEKTLEESSENLSWEAQTDENLRVLAQINVSRMHKSEETDDTLYFFAHKKQIYLFLKNEQEVNHNVLIC